MVCWVSAQLNCAIKGLCVGMDASVSTWNCMIASKALLFMIIQSILIRHMRFIDLKTPIAILK